MAGPNSGSRPAPGGPKGGAKPASAPAGASRGPAPAMTPEQTAAKAASDAKAEEARKAANAKADAEAKARDEKNAAAAAEQAAKVAAEKAAADAEAKRIEDFSKLSPAEVVKMMAADCTSAKSVATMNSLREFINHPKHQAARTNSVAIMSALATCDKKASFQPFLLDQLINVLERCDDRDAKLRDAAEACAMDIMKALDSHTTSLAIPVIFDGLNNTRKWKGKKRACDLLKFLAETHPKQLVVSLPDIIPILVGVVWDTKPEVKQAAHDALEASVQVVDNKDVEPVLDTLLTALITPEEVPECVHTLASITFVQTVDAPVLSLISPILVRGFTAPKAAVQRQCCVIIGNMAKLVNSPAEAVPFVETQLPLVSKACETISDPEAREVAERVQHQLQRILESAGESHLITLALVAKDVHDVVGIPMNCDNLHKNLVMNFATQICRELTNAGLDDVKIWQSAVQPLIGDLTKDAKATTDKLHSVLKAQMKTGHVEEIEDNAEILCDCKFTLAYGSKVLLHNAQLKLKRGYRYGLLGGNDSGKTTLMKAIANGQVDGFPPATELRTVFVEADINAELSHLSCINYIFEDEAIKNCGASHDEVKKVMRSVGFSDKMIGDAVSTLSGGWRMKLALARAMLQKADILLLDEPTNHLDVTNVAWVEHYLNSLSNVTSIIVSHDRGVLDHCCTHMLQIEDLKILMHTGNLTEFVRFKPSAMSFFSMKETKLKFNLPAPAFLDGVKSKGKVLMKMEDVAFTYPGNTTPTVSKITVQVSMSSRVACIGPNGAGKSTLIKLLTGELTAQSGNVWKHKEVRVAYVAQHAFHHIENHLTKTPNEYIRWRFQFGEDKEGLDQESMTVTDEEAAAVRVPCMIDVLDNNGNTVKQKRTPDALTGNRRSDKVGFQYEMRWTGLGTDSNTFLTAKKLLEMGFEKQMRLVDVRCRMREGMYFRALTSANVESHLADLGLEAEFATHYRISNLSAGQKVKVVLAAATWNQPHIIVLDEPTNYLSTDALGALANAIQEYEGGIVIISHNDEFCKTLCPETWVVEAGKLDVHGDADWMKNALAQVTKFEVIEEMTDALGNVSKVKQAEKKLSRKEQKARQRARKIRKAAGEVVSDSDGEYSD